MPKHYWNQFIVSWYLRNKFQRNLKQDKTFFFIQENYFKMSNAKLCPFCLDHDMLKCHSCYTFIAPTHPYRNADYVKTLEIRMLLVFSVTIPCFSCDQVALWMGQSFRLSGRLSVRDTFLTMLPSTYHHDIFASYYHWENWCPCEKSTSKVKDQGHRGQNKVSLKMAVSGP